MFWYSRIMYTVGQVARALDVSDTAIRQWTREFADHLSDDAVPPKGRTRQYNDEDVSILATVAVMRDQIFDFSAIHQAIEEGTRHEPLRRPESSETAQKQPPGAETAPAIGEAFNAALEAYKGELAIMRDELKDERAARLEAEKRAVKAETELEVIKRLYHEEQAQKPDLPAQDPRQEERTRSWLDRLLGR